MKKYMLSIIVLLTLASCKGQESKTEILDKLKYNADKSNYGIQPTFYYPTEISINDYPVVKGLEFFGNTIPNFIDIAINKNGEQELKILIDLSNYKKQGNPILKILLVRSAKGISIISNESDFPEENILVNYELSDDDITQENIKSGYFLKTLKFNAKIPVELSSLNKSVQLKNSTELLDKLYSALTNLTKDLNDKNSNNVLEIIQNAEFEVAQLRGMKKEWMLKEREALLSNTFTLLPKDSCDVKIYGNGTMATLVKKNSEIIKQSAITSKFTKGFPNGKVVQFYNFYYNIPKGKEELELIRFDGYAITKYKK
ncbi:hypothetical protein HS960_04610 [Sphingobacterium paramultivorum]|uniref:Lipoprotein n=1 Tax=Sphingobacterium paramultivorum TaxID=2886510 RepID=A0A7G5DZ04_9SPHI|nr:hypothetical protein [Sphingobacterium paramultivorum]QMV66979.1 hypothetical protein HS960_04610 [Sphingobacterium paramultivorum]WSO15819.1 hypothetical protein VUL84_04595 [Sphingobacterium paramultivorum]